MNYFGIDIGGSAIKYGEVNINQAIDTVSFDMALIPQAKPTKYYTDALIGLIQKTGKCKGIGMGFPSVVWKNSIMNLAVKYDDIWQVVSRYMVEQGIPHFAINDADAAGFAEIHHPSAEQYRKGVTIVLTLGTGIGSAIFLDGRLLPNTELGMIHINNMMAEQYCAASVKRRDDLSMQEWAGRLQEVICQIETILEPDYILLGGGISSDFEKYQNYLTTRRVKLAPAFYRNKAGVIGAALYAAYRSNDFCAE